MERNCIHKPYCDIGALSTGVTLRIGKNVEKHSWFLGVSVVFIPRQDRRWLQSLNITQGGLQCTYKVTLVRFRAAIAAVKSSVCYIFWVCVAFVALGIRHSMRMRRIFICGLSGYTMTFHTFLVQSKILDKICWTRNVYFDLLYQFETIRILRRIQRYIIINVRQSLCKVPWRYSCQILIKLYPYRQILEKS